MATADLQYWINFLLFNVKLDLVPKYYMGIFRSFWFCYMESVKRLQEYSYIHSLSLSLHPHVFFSPFIFINLNIKQSCILTRDLYYCKKHQLLKRYWIELNDRPSLFLSKSPYCFSHSQWAVSIPRYSGLPDITWVSKYSLFSMGKDTPKFPREDA
jgi:hypothetical protein